MLNKIKNLVPQNIKNVFHLVQAFKANITYDWPSKKLKVIGVTGTDGKTTTTCLIYHILISCGKKASMVSTVYAKIGAKVFDTGLHTTTPHSDQVQSFLKKSVEANDEYFILETTSHSLDQHRVWGIQFEVGVITNITHESLEYHNTFDNYVKAKCKLLLRSKTALINRDDKSYSKLKTILNHKNKLFQTYSLKEQAEFKLDISQILQKPLAEFNKYNFLAAYGVCKNLGLADAEIFAAMKTFQLPVGRMEVVYDKDFTVIVDFAHTPNAMVELLKGVRLLYPHINRLINVFGSAAHRDSTKRPMMGEASGIYADLTILTEDDPRDEGAVVIANQLAVGLEQMKFEKVAPLEFGKKLKTYTIIPDRSEALEKALTLAQRKDVVVLSGKGHEQSIARENREDPWSDKKETLKLLKKLGIDK